LNIEAPSQAVVVVSFMGSERTKAMSEMLTAQLDSLVLKLYTTTEALSIQSPRDISMCYNAALQLGMWHGYDLLEIASVRDPLLDAHTADHFAASADEIKQDTYIPYFFCVWEIIRVREDSRGTACGNPWVRGWGWDRPAPLVQRIPT